jgi:hypothetical protein
LCRIPAKKSIELREVLSQVPEGEGPGAPIFVLS